MLVAIAVASLHVAAIRYARCDNNNYVSYKTYDNYVFKKPTTTTCLQNVGYANKRLCCVLHAGRCCHLLALPSLTVNEPSQAHPRS